VSLKRAVGVVGLGAIHL